MDREEPDGLQSIGSQKRVGHDLVTKQHITPHKICLPLNGLTTT